MGLFWLRTSSHTQMRFLWILVSLRDFSDRLHKQSVQKLLIKGASPYCAPVCITNDSLRIFLKSWSINGVDIISTYITEGLSHWKMHQIKARCLIQRYLWMDSCCTYLLPLFPFEGICTVWCKKQRDDIDIAIDDISRPASAMAESVPLPVVCLSGPMHNLSIVFLPFRSAFQMWRRLSGWTR